MLNPKDTDANLLQKRRHQEAFSTGGVRRVHLFISLSAFEFGSLQLCDKTLEEVASVQALQVMTSEFQPRILFYWSTTQRASLPKADDYLTLEIMHEI